MGYRLIARAIAVAAITATMIMPWPAAAQSARTANDVSREQKRDDGTRKMFTTCAPDPFIVFFDAGSAEISPQTAQILQVAAASIELCGESNFDISGHSDRAGDAYANLTLSSRRADAVRDFLMRAGVPAARMRTAALGESCLIIPTGDGVAEPQNRRVEIRRSTPARLLQGGRAAAAHRCH